MPLGYFWFSLLTIPTDVVFNQLNDLFSCPNYCLFLHAIFNNIDGVLLYSSFFCASSSVIAFVGCFYSCLVDVKAEDTVVQCCIYNKNYLLLSTEYHCKIDARHRHSISTRNW